MSGTWRLRFDLRKGAALGSGQRRLRFERDRPGPAPAEAGPCFATTGISVDPGGANHGEDVTVAARDALREMLDHLPPFYPSAIAEMTLDVAESVGADSLWAFDHLLGVFHPDLYGETGFAEMVPDPDGLFDPFCLWAWAVAPPASRSVWPPPTASVGPRPTSPTRR